MNNVKLIKRKMEVQKLYDQNASVKSHHIFYQNQIIEKLIHDLHLSQLLRIF